MADKTQVYKCESCGNIVQVLNSGIGSLICCGEPMKHLAENTVDASKEKHIPVVEKTDNGIKVSVGSIAHPMEDAHYIEWIEVISDGKDIRKQLKPGDAPEATFCAAGEGITVRAYCNTHGLWKA